MKLLKLLIILTLIVFSLSLSIKKKNKSKKRCSDYLPPVTYPDMTKYYYAPTGTFA